MSDFVDRVTVHVKGGDGGNGSAGIRREKYKPLAGPNGGNGGDGGSVIFMADSNANSLLDYRFMPHREAESGTMGLGDTKDGSKGADLILPVPVGTVVFEAKGPQGKPKHPGEQLADLRHAGDKFVVAAGGNGGLGNAALANRTRRAPGFALLGEPGEERDVILELKSIADVALVGFPSAGKSSLIAAMSSAKPKIADYPFTTLVPNLGVVVAGDMRYTIADVPGLIPGASQGKGLGLEFLRHIERTEIIAHVIDCATLEPGRDPMSDYQALEHELAEYAGKLELPLGAIPIPERPRIIILNKVDVPEAKELAEFVKPEFEKLGLKVYIISTASHEGLKELNWALADLVTNMRAEVAKREQAEEEARVVIKPLEEPRNRVAVTTKAATRSTSPWNARRTATAKSGTRCSAPSRNAGSCRPTSIMTRPSATLPTVWPSWASKRAATQGRQAGRRSAHRPWRPCRGIRLGSDHRGRRGNARRHPVGRTRRRPATAGIGWSCAASFQHGTPSPVPRDDGRPSGRARSHDGRTQGRTLGRSFRGRRPSRRNQSFWTWRDRRRRGCGTIEPSNEAR